MSGGVAPPSEVVLALMPPPSPPGCCARWKGGPFHALVRRRVEGLEDAGDGLGRDAAAGVLHGHLDAMVPLLRAHDQPATVAPHHRYRLQRVQQHVQEDLLQVDAVAGDRRQAVFQLQVDPRLPRGGHREDERNRVLHDAVDVHRLALQLVLLQRDRMRWMISLARWSALRMSATIALISSGSGVHGSRIICADSALWRMAPRGCLSSWARAVDISPMAARRSRWVIATRCSRLCRSARRRPRRS